MIQMSVFKKITASVLSVCILTTGVIAARAAQPALPDFVHILGSGESQGVYAASDTDVPFVPDVSASQDLPAKYDGRTKGYITSAKNQGAANCCWAFSTVGAIEASFVKQGYGTVGKTDFSEAYLTWFGQRQRTTDRLDPTYGDGIMIDDPFGYGGNWQVMASTVFRGSGMQLESNAPWYLSDHPNTLKAHMTQPESDRYLSYARLWSAEGLLEPAWKDAWNGMYGDVSLTNQLWQQARSDAVVKMKQKIMENGAVVMSYFHEKTDLSDPYYNGTNHAYYRSVSKEETNHSVMVVGWDDSFSRSNFNAASRPSVDGAWLVKGSWGTSYALNGYYWISYAEPSIQMVATFRTTQADLYDNIYQYDGSYPSAFCDSSSGGAMANVFMAKSAEVLTHAVFYNTNVTPTDVQVDVYVSDDSIPQIGLDHNPIKKMRCVEEARVTLNDVGYGYMTVQLGSEVTLRSGQPFAIKVTFLCGDGEKIWIPVEGMSKEDPQPKEVAYSCNTNESFMQINGVWFDSTNIAKWNLNNVPVKAMTHDVNSYTPQLILASAPTRTQYHVGASLDLSGMQLVYQDKKGNQTSLTSGYTVTASAQSPFTEAGDVEVTVEYAAFRCAFTVRVDRVPGDSNGDGAVDLKDVTLLRRRLAGWTDTDAAMYDTNMDVDGDGKLSLLDVALMMRYLAGGYDVVLR